MKKEQKVTALMRPRRGSIDFTNRDASSCKAKPETHETVCTRVWMWSEDEPSTVELMANRHYLDVLVLLDSVTRDGVGLRPYDCKPKNAKRDIRCVLLNKRNHESREADLRDHEPNGKDTSRHHRRQPQR